MVTLVVAVAYFTAVYLGRRTRLCLLTQHILRSAKRIYGVPEFRVYAVADGIKQLPLQLPAGAPTAPAAAGGSVRAPILRGLMKDGASPVVGMGLLLG